MTLNEQIASKVKEKRLQAGISQGTLANQAGITMRTIQNIESGKPASAESMERLFKVLGIEIALMEVDRDE